MRRAPDPRRRRMRAANGSVYPDCADAPLPAGGGNGPMVTAVADRRGTDPSIRTMKKPASGDITAPLLTGALDGRSAGPT